MSAKAGKSPCAAGSGSSRTRIAVPPPLVAVTRFSLTYYARSRSANAVFSRGYGDRHPAGCYRFACLRREETNVALAQFRPVITGICAGTGPLAEKASPKQFSPMRLQIVAQGCRGLCERPAAFAAHHRTELIGSPGPRGDPLPCRIFDCYEQRPSNPATQPRAYL